MPHKKIGGTLLNQAIFRLDYTELSRLGKKGATSKKQRQYSKLDILLRGAEEAAHEAHLDVCPIEE